MPQDNPNQQPTRMPTPDEVARFLRAHPAYFTQHPEMLAVLLPPEQDHGAGVADFQRYAIANLQKSYQTMRDQQQALLEIQRDNGSMQAQVHAAALRLIRARDLEQLLEVITLDLVSLFEVDVVRLAMESDAAGMYETYYSEQNYSGLAFIAPGTADAALGTTPKGQKRQARLFADAQSAVIPGFGDIFEDCAGLVRSCVLLKLNLQQSHRKVILAFGAREKSRFHERQGIELLVFLARIVEARLDQCLHEIELP